MLRTSKGIARHRTLIDSGRLDWLPTRSECLDDDLIRRSGPQIDWLSSNPLLACSVLGKHPVLSARSLLPGPTQWSNITYDIHAATKAPGPARFPRGLQEWSLPLEVKDRRSISGARFQTSTQYSPHSIVGIWLTYQPSRSQNLVQIAFSIFTRLT